MKSGLTITCNYQNNKMRNFDNSKQIGNYVSLKKKLAFDSLGRIRKDLSELFIHTNVSCSKT